MNELAHLTEKVKVKKPRWGRRITWSILLIVGVYYVTLSIGVYSGAWQGARTQKVLRYTPLPVAMVGWHLLSQADFIFENIAIKHYNDYINTSVVGANQTATEDSSITALTKMIRETASERVAKNLGVTVSAADVEQSYQSQLLQNGNVEEVTAAIKDYYGWSPEEFKARVIKPAVLRNKLQEKLSFDENISANTKQEAERVLAKVKEGKESFSDIAKTDSQDVYGASGGDLGFVNQGEQVQEIDEASFSLELNTTSDLIHTMYGYHIIQVTERKTVDGQEQAHVFMITVLAPQVDKYINDSLKTTRITIFDRYLRWDKEAYRVSTTKNVPVANTNTEITNDSEPVNTPVNQ